MTVAAGVGITHAHLLAVLASSLPPDVRQVRMLDAGHGSASLIGLLHQQLGVLTPDLGEVAVHGFDIVDQALHTVGPLHAALDTLEPLDQRVPSKSRLTAIRARASWPYGDGSFDSVVSNQVLEHLVDLDHFFRETPPVLRPGGSSHHLYPLRDYVWEGHLLLPLVHRIRSHEARKAYIAALWRVGWGGTRRPSIWRSSQNVARTTSTASRRTDRWTKVADAAAGAGLRIDYGWTVAYYQKWRRLRQRQLTQSYEAKPSAAVQVAAFHVLKRLASVTITLTRQQTYVK